MKSLLKNIPNINSITSEINKITNVDNEFILKETINIELDNLRSRILNKELNEIDLNKLYLDIIKSYTKKNSYKHTACINGTGIIIHTNLGRSLLSEKQLENIDVLKGYHNLEFNLDNMKRGSRYDLVDEVISNVCHSESALVVNNNASAVMLVFNEFGKNKDVIVSNSELIEIGGSFRIPEIIKLSQANMKSVGTTNKTKLSDYINELNDNTGLVAKIHQSNFYIEGFTASVSAKELVDYRQENNLNYIIYEDLASGALIDLSKFGIDKEPMIQDSINDGVDIVSFSGDKLLGSVQAGIIIGKKEYIDRLKKNQLLRVLRPSALILNIIEATFKIYQNYQDSLENIPTLKYLSEDINLIKERAEYLKVKLNDTFDTKVENTIGAVGGGCMPKTKLASFGVSISDIDVNELKSYLIKQEKPIITMINEDKLIIDCKLLDYQDLDYIADKMNAFK